MKSSDEIRVETLSHRFFIFEVTQMILLEFMDCHGVIFQKLANGCFDLRIKHGKERIILLLLLIIFLNLSQAHHNLHVLMLHIHLFLDNS